MIAHGCGNPDAVLTSETPGGNVHSVVRSIAATRRGQDELDASVQDLEATRWDCGVRQQQRFIGLRVNWSRQV